MTDQPLVSVLMTSYNREKYIAEAIESVITSTYQNWELIIVDDHSKDNTVEIARKYEQQDKRIHVYINEKNLGDYPNRNKAASYAKGKYLKYLDADDLIYKHGLEIMVQTIEMYPEAGYALSMVEQDNARPYPYLLSCEEAYKRHYFQSSIFGKSPLGAIIKREAFTKCGCFTGKRMVGDFEMWHILSRKYPVVIMTGGLCWYRIHEEQQMTDYRGNVIFPFKYILISQEQINNPECPLINSDRLRLSRLIKKRLSKFILLRMKYFQLSEMFEMKKLSDMTWLSIVYNAFTK